MKAVPVRELLKFTPIELLNGLTTDLNILFEDDVVQLVPYKEIIIMRYIMDINVLVPDIEIDSKYVLSNYYVNGFYTDKSINKLLEHIVTKIIFTKIKPNNDDKTILEEVFKLIWEINNRIYNEVVFSAIEYSGSMAIEDVLEIQMDDRLIDSMKQVALKKDVDSVNNTYRVLEDIIYNKKEIKENQIVKGYIAGTINANQVKQLLGSRGFVTEIDNHIFKYPISSSFTLGMDNIYDMAIESRSGAKALFISTRAVRISEYFAREMQLVTMIVEKLVDGDCGNTNYINWYVRGPEVTGKSDIDNMVGKEFLDPDTGEKGIVTKNHKHLEGKLIKIRSVFGCKLKDKRCICSRCFGDLSYSITKNTNLGHFCSTELSEKETQNMLSTKHHTGSAASRDIILDAQAEQYFIIRGGNSYHFKSCIFNPGKTRYELVIDQISGFGLKDLNPNIDVNKLNTTRITRIEDFYIHKVTDKGEEYIHIVVRDGNKFGNFTYTMLDYIIKNGYSMDNQDRYVIDLSKWESKTAVVEMPDIEFDYLTLVNQVKRLFKSMETDSIGVGYITPEALLQNTFDLVNYKLNLNIALLEVIIYGFTINNPENGDYSLSRDKEVIKLGNIQSVMRNRSLGAGYGWEMLTKTVLSPKSYKNHNGIRHPMDVIIKPQEVIMDLKRRNNR